MWLSLSYMIQCWEGFSSVVTIEYEIRVPYASGSKSFRKSVGIKFGFLVLC